MSKPHILHLLSPLKHVSPFDMNMALDVGFDTVVPYAGVALEDVRGLVQDAIFSRAPQDGLKTGIFIGGRDAVLALDMMQVATKAMVPPFALSVFADPAGSFTTAAAMIATLEKLLRQRHDRTLDGLRARIFGGTGVVAFSAAVILAGAGAEVTLVGYDGATRVADASREIRTRFGLEIAAADGSSDAHKADLLADAEIALCAGRAGVQILSAEQIAGARKLLAAGDVNAVPPAGIEGLDLFASGTPLGEGGAFGIGPLAVGDLKYRTEAGLFRRMLDATAPLALDFRDAFALARTLAG